MVNVTVTSGGTSGPRGSGWVSGAGAPASNVGFDGDFYLDTTNVGVYYGPKTLGAWGSTHAFTGPLNNFAATVAPTVSNDSSQGYSVGSVWINVITDVIYVAANVAVGAAVWKQTINVGTAVAGDLSGTLPNPTVAKVNGISVSGTPAYGQVPAANSSTAATWQIMPGFMGSTGVLTGGNFTINGVNPAAFDITQTIGYITDYTTNPASPIVTKVTIPAQTVAITGANVNNAINWWVADSTGAISSIGPSHPNEIQRRTTIQLGATGSIVGTGVIVTVAPAPAQITQPTNQLFDLMYDMGPFNVSGNVISANGANLTLAKTAGIGNFVSFNAASNPSDPNSLPQPTETPVQFRYSTQVSGSEISALRTTIDPANYDVNGVITPIPGGTNTASIQRVWLFTGGAGKQTLVQYGQATYSSLAAAQAAIGTTNYVVNPDFMGTGFLACWLCVIKSATDLSNSSQAVFVIPSKFPKP